MAKVKLEVIPWLTDYFGARGASRLVLEEEAAEGQTVRDLLDRLAARYQEFGNLAFDADKGQLSGHITVICNDRLLELLSGLDTVLKDGDAIMLLPAYAGG